jgi:hypothetical protein
MFFQYLFRFEFMVVGKNCFIAEVHCIGNLILIGIAYLLINYFITMVFIVLNLKEHVLA